MIESTSPYAISEAILRPLATQRFFDVFDLMAADGRLCPVLYLLTDDGPVIDLALLRYIGNLRANGASRRRLRACCVTLGLLYEYHRIVSPAPLASADDFRNCVGNFLYARRHGVSVNTARGTLNWQPVQITTVLRDRSCISEYAENCLSEVDRPSMFERFTLIDKASPSYSRALREVALKAARSRDTAFLAHLSDRIRPRSGLPFGYPERASRRSRSSRRDYLEYDAIRRLIDNTKSLMQKMLFIEAHFGGPCLSEMLNHWRCDVMAGENRPILFADDEPSDLPLVILAHPAQALYTGQFHNYNKDRLQHLKSTYKLSPRCEREGHADSAGWKGIVFDNEDLRISQIFWCDREYALLYQECYRSAQTDLYPQIDRAVLGSHPYLYVNDQPGRREFGQPMKVSNVSKAYQRAIEKLGANARGIGFGVHGARHAYKGMLKDSLHLSRDDCQRCMHHGSPFSQDYYGQSVRVLNAKMQTAIGNRTYV